MAYVIVVIAWAPTQHILCKSVLPIFIYLSIVFKKFNYAQTKADMDPNTGICGPCLSINGVF